MPTRSAVHLSTERDPVDAGRRAASGAALSLGAKPELALVFATVGYDQAALLAAIRAELGPACAVVGCSGEGVISGGDSQEVDHAVSVLVTAFDGVEASAHLVEGFASDPEGAARELARRVGNPQGVLGLLVFPDGLSGDCSRFLRVLESELPGVKIVGGTSGDAMTFERTYQYGPEGVQSGAVSAAVLRGRGELRVAVSHGCTPCGPHQTITRIDGNWVEGIDGRPAWEVFKEFLDGDAQDLNAEGIVHLCIGIAADPSAPFVDDPMIIRTPLSLDKATGALLFPGGGLVKGQRIRITRRDAERIRVTAAACAQRLVKPGEKPPAFVLQFDCAGRGKVMFGDSAAAEIIEPLRAEIGRQVAWSGFHTYGEIAGTEHGLDYHNYTVALCAFHDA
ncbi:MAG TPA: FIST N-terminal domain-containing protein [Polyangiaceae bacterium]|nr:FIST N-terminal domain-containing protein [Polyangiaceae bacterium]